MHIGETRESERKLHRTFGATPRDHLNTHTHSRMRLRLVRALGIGAKPLKLRARGSGAVAPVQIEIRLKEAIAIRERGPSSQFMNAPTDGVVVRRIFTDTARQLHRRSNGKTTF